MPQIIVLPHAELCPEGAVIAAKSGASICDNLLDNGIEIEHACEKSCACTTCHVVVREGFDTLVGERGITLSGGQKQRTAIARAVLREPKILILDDALSSVDTYTEERILSQLRGVMRQRTSIIVSHRLAAVRDADWILVLDGGRIVEQGTHADLIARGGRYWELLRRQQLEEELEEEEITTAPGA